MMARVLAVFRPRRAAPGSRRAAPVAGARTTRSRRGSARAAVWSGAVAFAAANLALAGALEGPKPQWRDPEFALRLSQVRRWREEAPRRPLVLALGSSRTQMGLSPAAMGFPDEPGSPLVYNFGYRAAHPLGAWFQLMRVLDAGVRPDFVLVQLAAVELVVLSPAENQLAAWGPRMSAADLGRLAPYADDAGELRALWLKPRLAGWSTYRGAVLSDLLPDWQDPRLRAEFTWEAMDRYGFTPHAYEAVTAAERARLMDLVGPYHRSQLLGLPVGEVSDRAYRDLIARCRAEGIRLAFFWSPESPAYRGWYSPACRAVVDDYTRTLTRLGVPVFPAPDLPEEAFVDGFHLLRGGAGVYSRWLADTHLRPWLARQGVAP